jgi:hypothetical protein
MLHPQFQPTLPLTSLFPNDVAALRPEGFTATSDRDENNLAILFPERISAIRLLKNPLAHRRTGVPADLVAPDKGAAGRKIDVSIIPNAACF